MIGDAIDAATVIGWALLAWIVVGAVVVTAGLYAVGGLLVWAGRWAWKTAARAWSAARTDARDSEAEREPRDAHDAHSARTAIPHPTGLDEAA